MGFWNKVSTGLGFAGAVAAGKPGMRAYAIGDVHGCIDQLERLLAAIEADIAAHPEQPTFVVFLGDLIDRGPDSGGVIERLLHYAPAGVRPIFIQGNHEEFLLRALDGEPGVLHQWLEFGGRECVQSYGLRPSRLAGLDDESAAALLREFIPERHRTFIRGFADTFRFGDYLFVHAGIRPGVPLEEQRPNDLRWIRQPFLGCKSDHGVVVVHGHTIAEAVEERTNRIGIDTGAYQGGPLTALVIDGDTRRFLQVSANPGSSIAATRPIGLEQG